MFRTVLSFDMRAPEIGAPSSELYPAALDMCEFGDKAGIDAVIFPEHHGSEDGYNPVPSLLATAVAARTRQMGIVLGAIVLPLHDPVEVAETIAVADNICEGRLYTTLAAGYVKSEFAMFGKSLGDRAQLMDEGLDVIVRALKGERFDYQGRDVFVRPLAHGDVFDRILVGGGVKPAARRAARHGLGLWVLQPEMLPECQELIAYYKAQCGEHGHGPGPIMSTHPAVHVTRDVDAAWEQVGPHIMHLVDSYASWASDVDTTSSPFYGMDSIEKVRAAGFLNVMTPEQAVAFAKQSPISLTPLISGLDPKAGWEMLELFVSDVLPHIREG